MGDNEPTQTMDDPRHAVPNKSAPRNYDRIQTVPCGFFELWHVENRDSGQNIPCNKATKNRKATVWEKVKKRGKSSALFSSILIGNNVPRWEKDYIPHLLALQGWHLVRENIWKIIILLIK